MYWRESYSSPINSQRILHGLLATLEISSSSNIHFCCYLQPCCHHDLATPSRYLAVCHRICTNSLPPFFPLSLLHGGTNSGFWGFDPTGFNTAEWSFSSSDSEFHESPNFFMLNLRECFVAVTMLASCLLESKGLRPRSDRLGVYMNV
jgi:hypothetical protein